MSVNSLMMSGEIDYIDIRKQGEKVWYEFKLKQIEEDGHINLVDMKTPYLTVEESDIWRVLRMGHSITIEGRLRVARKNGLVKFYIRVLSVERVL